MKRLRIEQEKSELDLYLVEGREMNIMIKPVDWWKSMKLRYLALSKMACDYLAIPASSASVERVFSAEGRLITDSRDSLHPLLVFAYMSLITWWEPSLIMKEWVTSSQVFY